MSNKTIIIILVIALALLGLTLYYIPYRSADLNNSGNTSGAATQADVERYVRANISTLSPEPAVMGGIYYVTDISFEGENSGVVHYEDGHVAHSAAFTYSIGQNGEVSIDSFEIVPESETFISEDLGFRFNYPAYYFLEVKDRGTAEQKHIAIILTEDTEENRLVREGQAPGREGPVSINIDVYQNDVKKLTAEQWVRNETVSNFKLSPDGILTQTTLVGRPAVSYKSSGLYEIDNVVVADDRYVYSFVVNYLTPSDVIRKDFGEILKTVTFL